MTTKSLPAVATFNPQNDAPNDMNHLLTRQELKGLPHFLTQDAITAAIRLNKLVQEDPEHLLERSGLLIDTDPRHVGKTPIQSLELPGVSFQPNVARPASVAAGSRLSSRHAAKEVENTPISFSSHEQNMMEEASAREKLLYEMKQNLQKLREYGKMIGISFDVSKKKSQHGRFQGEKWMDDELQTWKHQASRFLTDSDHTQKKMMEEEPYRKKVMDYLFKLERILNEIKHAKISRQKQKAKLENELQVSIQMEEREQSGSGKLAEAFSRISNLKERIQDTDQKILDENAQRMELEKEHEVALKEMITMRNLVEKTEDSLKEYSHDFEVLRLQLRDNLHEVEKSLGQGKLLTMLEVKDELQGKFKGELEQRQRMIQRQIRLKEIIQEHEERVKELTSKLQHQYDPNKDSPRRNELKKKAKAFEEVFNTMMQKIGESDITRIVELFQKQTLTFQAWTEAVRDQEIRVKALKEEKKFLDRQLLKLSSKTSHSVENETRQFTLCERNYDMALERLDALSVKLYQLESLMSHIKESIRLGFLRMKSCKDRTEIPPESFPDEGEGGLTEWVTLYADSLLAFVPNEEQLSALGAEGTDKELRSPVMPKKLKEAVSKANKSSGVRESNAYNTRVSFTSRMNFPKVSSEREREEEEGDTRAEYTEEAIVSRDEMKRRTMRYIKLKEREKMEADAKERGETNPNKKKKSKNASRIDAAPSSPPGQPPI